MQPTNTARWHWNRVVGDRTYGFTAISKSKQTGNGGAKLSSAPWSATPIWRPPERGCEHLRLSANQETVNLECPTMGGLIDRYIEQVLRPCIDVPLGGVQDSASPISFQCAKSYSLNAQPVGPSPLGELSALGFQQAGGAGDDRGMAAFLVALAQERQRAGAQNRSLDLERDEARVQVCGQVGLPQTRTPWAKSESSCRAARPSVRNRPVQLTAAQFFLLLTRLGPCEKVAVAFAGWLGPRISEAFGLKWQDLDLSLGVVSFRQGCVQGRITPLKTEASRTNLPMPGEVLELLHRWRSVSIHRAPDDWVFASPYTKGKRPFWPAQLLKAHIKPIALAAGLPNIGWHSFRHTVSAWGKEAGLELEEVKTLLRHENLATTSEVYGDLGMEAKRRIQQQLVNFVKQQATRTQ